MSTLIRNVGILDARKATPEKLLGIGKLNNIGVLVVNPEIKEQLMKISMMNVGSTLELTEDYKFHIGPKVINRQLLEDSETPVKLVVVGQINVEPDIPVELLQAKLGGLYLVGQAAVPENLYGAFMAKMKEVTGMVDVLPASGKGITGKVTISNVYLEGLEDGTELNVLGKVIFEEGVDPGLFTAKIAALHVTGAVGCLDTQEGMLRKVLRDTGKVKVKITRGDCHYLPDGTRLDPFTLLSVKKPVICCSGVLVLDEQITPELFKDKDVRFEAGTIYFPTSLMSQMLTRLEKNTKGLAYEPGKLELATGEQQMTPVRLEAMADKSTLVVSGALAFDPAVMPETIAAKIGVLDLFGQITAAKDAASILQSKLRQNDGAIKTLGEEEEEEAVEGFDHVIENVATYVL
jgi:hypothetical protein